MLTNSIDLSRFAIMLLGFVFTGMLVLVAVAFIRRWQQVHQTRDTHRLQVNFRPILAKILSGERSASLIETLRQLTLDELDVFLDPLFSRRKLTDRQRQFLQNLCNDLGLIPLWQRRIAVGHRQPLIQSKNGATAYINRPSAPFILRVKGIRNLGILAHQPSWRILASTLSEPNSDIQMAALRSLASLGGQQAFEALRERLHAFVQGECSYPPMQSLLAAMSRFDMPCMPALMSSLSHVNRQVRLHALEILRMMISRESVRHPSFSLNQEMLTPSLADLLFLRLATDASAEVRARTAEVLVYIADPRTTLVLHNLLHDAQWFVRLRTLASLSNLRLGASPLHLDIRGFLRDPQWQVREAAIQSLISLKHEDRYELYRFYLGCPERSIRQQIAEMFQRTGLMSTLIEDYTAGVKGLPALVVEELASHSGPTGIWGLLRTTAPEIQQRFIGRYGPLAQAQMLTQDPMRAPMERFINFQQPLEFPSHFAA